MMPLGRAVLAAAVLLLSLDVAAAPRPRGKISVLGIVGPGGTEVYQAVTWVLDRRGFRLVPPDEMEQAAALLQVSPGDTAGLRALAAELGLSAVITGRVTVKGRLRTARIEVHDGRTGEVAVSATFSGRTTRALMRGLGAGFWRRLGPIILRRQPPPARAPAARPGEPTARLADLGGPPGPPVRRTLDEDLPYPEEEASPEPVIAEPARPPPPPPARPRPGIGPAAVELSIGPRVLYRQLTFDSDPDDALTPFRTRRPAPALGLEAAWFPRLVTPRLGVAAALEYGAPLQTRSTTDLSYQLPNSDLRASVLIGHATRLATVDLALGTGRQRFGVVPEGAAVSRPRMIPDVYYQYLRTGFGARFYPGGRLGLCAGAYYRHVLSSGAIGSHDWFPSSRALGAEAMVGVSYRVLPAIEARLHGEMRLYRFAIDPNGGGGHVSTGALDQYWSAWLAMAVLLGGEGERH
jgi:hypothetical protein